MGVPTSRLWEWMADSCWPPPGPGGGQQLSAIHSQSLEVWYAHVPG